MRGTITHNNTYCNNTLCRLQYTTIRHLLNDIMDPLLSVIKEHSAKHCKNKIITVRTANGTYISDIYLHEHTTLDVHSSENIYYVDSIFRNGIHNTVQDQLRLFNYIPRIVTTTSNINNKLSTVHIGNNINMNNSSICIYSLL